MAVEHFGERVLPGKYGLRLTRELYALPNSRRSLPHDRRYFSDAQWEDETRYFVDADHTIYRPDHVAWLQERALHNFDLNMAYFARIPQEVFDAALEALLERTPQLQPVVNLKELENVEGVYVMVLDQYRQIYTGKAYEIRQRIRSHWTGTKQLDRLVFGDVAESVLSIDSFRALDTTRIFAAATENPAELETEIEAGFPRDFALNRIWGGPIDNVVRALLVRAEVKRRRLID